MTDKQLADIRECAIIARKWGERMAKRGHCDEDLCGLCARASGYLAVLLRRKGFKPVFVWTQSYRTVHVHLKVLGHIVDITATQFQEDHPNICIVKIRKNMPWYWNQTKAMIFDNAKDLRVRQIKEGWPTQQIVRLRERIKCA